MSYRGNRLAGHGLVAEGRPYLRNTCCGGEMTHGTQNQYDRIGHALCSCGQFGPCQDTNGARKQWHRDHKNQLRTDAYFAALSDGVAT